MEKSKESVLRDVVRALRQVYDPEIPVNIYDLGLIYDLKIDDDHKVFIKMTLTAPNCPMADEMLEQVNEVVKDTPGVTDAAIELVFEPAWDKSRMSEEAMLELGML
ncbi:MAG: iron-sulfur cluster assembly protein [Bacteroidales bacterium]|nr:iron-sulfur cluster assembly protein [Bacteroidales bacterium]